MLYIWSKAPIPQCLYQLILDIKLIEINGQMTNPNYILDTFPRMLMTDIRNIPISQSRVIKDDKRNYSGTIHVNILRSINKKLPDCIINMILEYCFGLP